MKKLSGEMLDGIQVNRNEKKYGSVYILCNVRVKEYVVYKYVVHKLFKQGLLVNIALFLYFQITNYLYFN